MHGSLFLLLGFIVCVKYTRAALLMKSDRISQFFAAWELQRAFGDQREINYYLMQSLFSCVTPGNLCGVALVLVFIHLMYTHKFLVYIVLGNPF